MVVRTVDEIYVELKNQFPDWNTWNLESAKAANVTLSPPTAQELGDIVKKQEDLLLSVKVEIKNLAQRQKKIENVIYEIKSALERANVTLDNNENLADEFEKFVARYRNIIKASKDVASNLSGYARSWVQVTLPTISTPNVTLDDLKKIFQVSLQEAQQRRDESEALRNTMETFVADLKQFNSVFQDWANKKKKELTAEIKEILDEIAKLEGELADVRTVLGVGGSMLTIGVSVAAITVGALLASNPISLPLAIGLFILAGGIFLGGLSSLIWAGVRSNRT